MGVKKDLTGQRFGDWTVLYETPERDARGNIMWVCRCACGIEKPLAGNRLLRGETSRCRACWCRAIARARFVDLTGRVYGEWTVLGFSHTGTGRTKYWKCVCSCGHRQAVQASALRSKNSTRCMSCRTVRRRT